MSLYLSEALKLIDLFKGTSSRPAVATLQEACNATGIESDKVIEYLKLFEAVQKATLETPILAKAVSIIEYADIFKDLTGRLRAMLQRENSQDAVELQVIGKISDNLKRIMELKNQYEELFLICKERESIQVFYETIIKTLQKFPDLAPAVRKELIETCQPLAATSHFFQSVEVSNAG